jgi:MFS family permease
LGVVSVFAVLLLLQSSHEMVFIVGLSGALAGLVGVKVTLALGCFITAAGLAFLGLEHGTQAEVLVGGAVMGAGIGFAFAAMPNLIVEAVPPEQTGEATGFNALVRAVGSSLGTQVTAAVLAGSAAAGSAVATDDGFTKGFLVGAGVAVVAGVAACLIPRSERHVSRTILADTGAAAPLGEPAYAEER